MGVLLGLAAALGFGAADFLGGWAARTKPALGVLGTVQATGLVIAAAWVWLDGVPLPPGGVVATSMLAGAFGVTGLGLFYQALATGRMGVVAPVTAVLSSLIPVTWGLTRGERPSTLATAGIVIAILSAGLISREPDREAAAASARALGLALAAGVAFGVAVALFSEAAGDGAFWPLLLARGVATPGVWLVIALTGTAVVFRGTEGKAAFGGGVLDLAGNAAIIEGFRHGLTSVVSPVAALFPGATVLMARVFLDERLARHQITGIGGALLGLVLIGSG